MSLFLIEGEEVGSSKIPDTPEHTSPYLCCSKTLWAF